MGLSPLGLSLSFLVEEKEVNIKAKSILRVNSSHCIFLKQVSYMAAMVGAQNTETQT